MTLESIWAVSKATAKTQEIVARTRTLTEGIYMN
jgi:hypothetical protein